MKRLLLLWTCLWGAGYAQPNPLAIGEVHTLRSEILQEDRELAIFTPSDYAEGGEACQVLYVLDGEWNVHFVAALVDKWVSSGDMPRTMVVGLINRNRSKDLTPPGIQDNPKRFGGGEQFLSFITDELQPWVESRYRTLPYRTLAGHSFGGLFTIYAMLNRPAAFQAYIALSPSLGRNGEQQVKKAATFFAEQDRFPKSLYLAVGNETGYTYTSSVKFSQNLDKQLPADMRFQFEHLRAENHVSISASGFMQGLRFIHQGYNAEKLAVLDEIFLVEAHYAKLAGRYGHEIAVPESFYQHFVKEQIGEREYDYAFFILGKYRDAYPGSLALLGYLANVHLLKGDFAQAKSYYLQLKEKGVEDEYMEQVLKQLK